MGFGRAPLRLSGPLWISLGVLVLSGTLWTSLALCDPLWASLGLSGLPWASQRLSGLLSDSLGLPGSLWPSLGFFGPLQISSGLSATVWDSLAPLGISGPPCASLPFPGSVWPLWVSLCRFGILEDSLSLAGPLRVSLGLSGASLGPSNPFVVSRSLAGPL